MKHCLLKTSKQQYAREIEQNILISSRLVFFHDKNAGKEVPQETQKLEKKFILPEELGINVENSGAEAKKWAKSLIEHAQDDSNKLEEDDEKKKERVDKEFELLQTADINIKNSISAISNLESKANQDKRKRAAKELSNETGIAEEESITDQTDVALNLTAYYKGKIWAETFGISQKVAGYMKKMYDKLSNSTLDYNKDVNPPMDKVVKLASKIKKILS